LPTDRDDGANSSAGTDPPKKSPFEKQEEGEEEDEGEEDGEKEGEEEEGEDQQGCWRYRQGAVFVMASDTLARIRKMKTSDGAFIWSPGLTVGQPGTLLGFPVVEAEDMPAVAADSLSIAFGNFQAAYVIADRGETSVLRDP
jgi:hypothetical protein